MCAWSWVSLVSVDAARAVTGGIIARRFACILNDIATPRVYANVPRSLARSHAWFASHITYGPHVTVQKNASRVRIELKNDRVSCLYVCDHARDRNAV